MDKRESQKERILVVDAAPSDRERAREALSRYFPDADVDTASSCSELQSRLPGESFDIVVLDYELSREASLIELLYRMKIQDYEPSVVVVSRESSAALVNELYKHGCHRCIEKDGRWLTELGGAVDSLIKLRKARAENLLLRAKLTETNMLLREKNKRLDEFGATVAHDIRGPLGGISMKLEYLLDTYGEGVEPRFRQLLERCLQSTERLTQLVQAMYEYARLGPKAARMEEVQLTDLIQEVLEDMPFDQSLDVRVELDELPAVYAAPDLLRRVFVNLVNNAVKYNDKEFVLLRFRLKRIHERVLAPVCEFTVEDNGRGIPPLELKDVFSMFVRASSSAGDDFGMGVGLAVVKRIIDLHYGSISVTSEVGQGTTFHITLPMRPLAIAD